MVKKLQLSKRIAARRLRAGPGSALIAAIAFAVIGYTVIQLTSAASFVNSSEVETGTIAGAASKVNDSSASNGQAVAFGNGTPIPANVQAITGGNSIALLWDMPRRNVKSVEVFRNDVKVANLTPGSGVIAADKLATRYIDRAVSSGQTYNYKVRLTTAGNNVSSFSAAVSATQPAASATTPVPTVTIDASQASDLANYLNTYAKAEIETWYPKISDVLAYPSYTPINSMKLLMDTSNTGVANASYTSRTISVNPTWLRDNPADGAGMFIHESTHILQAYPPGSDTSGWATEGIADWPRDWLTRERFYIPTPNEVLGGYHPGALVARWAEKQYSPGFVRKLNIALHNGSYTASFIANLTGGRSATTLFNEAKAAQYGGTAAITSTGGKCIGIQSNSSSTAAKMQLETCNGASGQKWTTVYRDAGAHGGSKKTLHLVNSAVAPEGRCIDVYGYAITDESTVDPYYCQWNANQEWVRQTDGSLLSPYSGKCLSTAGKSSADGAQIVIATCDGSAAQRWTVPD